MPRLPAGGFGEFVSGLAADGAGGGARQTPFLAGAGRGVIKRPAIANNGRGIHAPTNDADSLIHSLADRLRLVRVCCGDWKRVCTPAVTTGVHADTAIFLDPPYGVDDRADVYNHESRDIAQEVLAWCIENGDKMKIALCGYSGEYESLLSLDWDVVYWKASGGFANQRKSGVNDNARRERIWFSPRCIKQARLF